MLEARYMVVAEMSKLNVPVLDVTIVRCMKGVEWSVIRTRTTLHEVRGCCAEGTARKRDAASESLASLALEAPPGCMLPMRQDVCAAAVQ